MVSSSSARVLPRLLKSSHLTGVDSHSRFGTLDQQSRRLRLPRARLLALPGAGGWSSDTEVLVDRWAACSIASFAESSKRSDAVTATRALSD